jgi:recombination protein RecT
MSEIQKQPVNGLVNFNRFLTNDRTKDYLGEVLGAKKDSFVTNCVSLVSNNVNLQACDPKTIMYSAIKATTLGLPLDNNLGFAYVLPYRNNQKGIDEAQFQMGYKGFIQLAMRSAQFQTINSTDVRKGEILDIDRLTGEINFAWLPGAERLKAPKIGFIAYFKLINGFTKSLYMTVEELQDHGKKYSKSYNSKYSNWQKMFDAMATKTVI